MPCIYPWWQCPPHCRGTRMNRNILLLTLLVLAGLAAGCGVGAQPPTVATDTPATPQQQLPFVESKTLVVPANTAIYVRLQQSISSATAQSGQNFSAELDEPLVVEGQTLAPKGAPVTGKVVAARESGHMHNAGYLRITLSSITLNGKTVPSANQQRICERRQLQETQSGIHWRRRRRWRAAGRISRRRQRRSHWINGGRGRRHNCCLCHRKKGSRLYCRTPSWFPADAAAQRELNIFLVG